MKTFYLVCYAMRDSCCEHTKAFPLRENAEKFMAVLTEIKTFNYKCLEEANKKADNPPYTKWYQIKSTLFNNWLDNRNKIYFELLKQMPENLKVLDELYPQLYIDVWIEEIEVEEE